LIVDDPGIVAPAAGDRFGHAILVADLAVDASVPSDEFVVGAPGVRYLQDTATNAGAAYYYFSSAAGLLLTSPPATGANIDSKLGWALGNANVLYQDVCSPAAKCIAVGAPGAKDSGGSGTAKGAAYIGTPGSFSGSVASGPFRVLGENTGDAMGTGFASADLNADTISELFIGQGGSASTSSPLTAFYGGVGIVLGAQTAPGNPLTPLAFNRHFPDLDVDPVTGFKVETRIGGPMLATAADPVSQGGVITRLIVGAPGGQRRFPILGAPVPGRLHVFRRATFDY